MREQSNPLQAQGRLQLNKRLYIVLVCFLIAAVFWLLIALSNDYPTSYSVSVKYVNLPGKKVITNELPSKITVNMKASGFLILSYDFQKTQKTVEIDIGSRLKNMESLEQIKARIEAAVSGAKLEIIANDSPSAQRS